MKKIAQFFDNLQKFSDAKNEIISTQTAENMEERFSNVYQKFYSDLLTSMSSHNRLRKHEMCSTFKLLENTIRLIDRSKVQYRVLMAVNIFKNSNGSLSDSDRELSKAFIFPSEKYVEETLVVISEAIMQLRSFVGLKALHEAIAIAWSTIKDHASNFVDDVGTGVMEESTKMTSPDAFSHIFESVSIVLNVPSIYTHSGFEEIACYIPNEIQWLKAEKEVDPTCKVEDNEENCCHSNSLQEQSVDHNLTTLESIVSSITSMFPDNCDTIIKHLFDLLTSDRSNNELQGELIDLLGFEQFEMVIRVLEIRYQLANDIKKVEQQAVKSSNIPANKPAPLCASFPSYCQQVVVQTKADVDMRREIRKEQKRAKKELNRIHHAFGEEEKLELELAQKEILRQRQLEIDQLKWNPTLKSVHHTHEVFPFVFDARLNSESTMVTINGMKYVLPEGSSRESQRTYEKIDVPPVDRKNVQDIQHIYIKDMDPLAQLGFKDFEKLNAIQSLVYEQAYKTKENLLICAPTGAGKTNIAMLAILRTVHEYQQANGDIAMEHFKIIYIAPMKALATEMTENFGKRLAPLGLKVRELTGDTQLSKKEISETQMLILTPEKWDVVTRKSISDSSLTGLVRLLIIDEVHLLHDERGPVIETIVARTLRQVEMSQTGIRIVGLSATLPNYVDVARFLRVNPYKGLFFFDGRFRPVPLTQKFIGIKKVGGVRDVQQVMDEVCYDEVINYVKRGHQVLVFVHARNATSKLAQTFRERAAQLGHLEAFIPQCIHNKNYIGSEKAIQSSRNHQLFELFRFGFGIHHAGLVRRDRILMEKVFSSGHISVLFCTATLAWGVNLPAHAVVIRGTEVFDAEKGQFTDLGVLDVQQIFGRAGRPQFENEGHGVIITTQNKMDKYLAMLVRQTPIESQFFKRIHDNLNAEIALGTVSNVEEAVEWLTYTYYYTRAFQNPIAYGLSHNVLEKDPDLHVHLSQMVTDVAVKLDRNQMIRFDSVNSFLNATDLGRIASNFYIKYETIEMINDTGLPVSLSPFMPDDMVLAIISKATEFSQLKVREEECLDLEELVNYGCVLPIRGGGLASVPGKVNVLLQAHISRSLIRSFSLMSEALYVQQNASRLCRAMFEITLRKGWAQATNAFLVMSKCIEKKIWPNQSSLRQFPEFLPIHLIEKIERRKLTESQLLDLEVKELGHMFSCDGEKLYQALRMLPRLEIEATIKPITYTIVQVSAVVTPAFIWNAHLFGKSGIQSFWLIFENINENLIVYQERLTVNMKRAKLCEPQCLVFTIPVRDHQLTNIFQLRISSEYYLVEDTVVPLSMHNCVLPKSFRSHTDLLPLDPLPIKTLRNKNFESIYNFAFFNPIQTQVFHCLYKTDENVLIGAPTGSGKTLCAELAMFHLLQDHPSKKCVYIAPMKAIVRERVADWKEKFEQRMGYKVIEISGDYTPDINVLNVSPILVTTPEKWDGITRGWATREYVRQVGLIIIDEIHLLGVDRGAVLEAIVTRLKFLTRRSCVRESPARLLGLSTALANAGDVAEWLGIKDDGLFNFRPSVRPVPINVHIQGFPGPHYCPRMALMNKPAFKSIITYSPLKPVLVFVASRRQTRLTAMAFISHLVSENDPRQWLHMDISELETLLFSVKDENLKLTLPFGIGLHHAGLSTHERALVEQLYVEKKIQVLIATATLAWGINMPAHLVIVKGTEYFDGKTGKYIDFPVTDVLQMMGRAGRPQFDTSAVAIIYVQDSKKNFYKRFLYEPFPVESSLLPVLPNHINAEICGGTITSKQSVMEYLAGTYFYRRLFANPNYYGLEDLSEESVITFLMGVIDQCVSDLLNSKCIILDEEQDTLRPSPYGRIASTYYLQHHTVHYFLEHMNSECSIMDLLSILSNVPEYAEIPVRHNEDVVNSQLQKRLRVRFSTSVMDSPHTKTHLLFQAHFSRIDIPTDYRTDQKSVLDQCVRILQAMRDICLLRKWMSTAINVTILQQMCYSASWYDNHPLLCLPHLKDFDAEQIGIDLTIPILQNQIGIERMENINSSDETIRKLLECTTLDEVQVKEVLRSLCCWPILSIDNIRISHGTYEERMLIKDVEICRQKEWIRLKRNKKYRLKINMDMLGPNKFNSSAYLPQWAKEKFAGWFLIVGEKDTNTLISIGYVAPIQGHCTGRADIITPDKSGRCILTVIIMSDCYLGIDQELMIYIELE